MTDPNATTTLHLRPPRHRVERRAILWWTLQSLLFGVPLLAATIVAHVLWGDAQPWLALTIVAAAVLLVVGVAVEPWWRYSVHRWEATDEAVYGLSGWLVQEWRVAPLARVQTVDAVRGPLEQMLGLATLRITTASSKGAVDIPGLDKDIADEVAQRLAVVTQQTPGDAT